MNNISLFYFPLNRIRKAKMKIFLHTIMDLFVSQFLYETTKFLSKDGPNLHVSEAAVSTTYQAVSECYHLVLTQVFFSQRSFLKQRNSSSIQCQRLAEKLSTIKINLLIFTLRELNRCFYLNKIKLQIWYNRCQTLVVAVRSIKNPQDIWVQRRCLMALLVKTSVVPIQQQMQLNYRFLYEVIDGKSL